jgi:hypothetical protein
MHQNIVHVCWPYRYHRLSERMLHYWTIKKLHFRYFMMIAFFILQTAHFAHRRIESAHTEIYYFYRYFIRRLPRSLSFLLLL